jgi:hypothetical protein
MRRLLIGVFGFALASCVMQDVRLEDQHLPATRRQLVGNLDCRLPAFELVDVRDHPGMGWIGPHELGYPGLERWISDALKRAAAADADAPPLRIELNRAYIESHPSGHSFQLVLRARGAADEPWRIYRGSVSRVTWWGSDSEFGGYVTAAAAKSISALLAAEGQCGGKRSRSQ